MIKKTLFFLHICVSFLAIAQSSFEYERTWGTYFGPVASRSWIQYNINPIYFDSQNNIYTNGQVHGYNNYPNTYYDQFIMGNGQAFFQNTSPPSQSSNITNAKFSSAGILQKYEYYSNLYSPQGYGKTLRYIDNNDNKYYEYRNIFPFTATAGTWLTAPPISYAMLLVKESAAGTVLWATYLPSHNTEITGDQNGNIYIGGSTGVKQGITTSSTFQENYLIALLNGQEIQNGFLVMLNASGQRIWGTYFPGLITKLQYFDNQLYFLGLNNMESASPSIVTSNSFQSTSSRYFLQKFDAISGNRIWGTYYGKPGADYNYRMYNIAVNEYGLYIMGDANSANNSTVQDYFGTAGSHQQNIAGQWDIFLSKFNLNGNRSWSTYFGSSATDTLQDITQPIALSGENIFICGYSWGIGGNLATAEAYQSTPQFNTNNSTNQFFAKFNTNGNLIWSSYYGGTNFTYASAINIAVNKSSLYLYGETTSPNGFATPGCWQPQIIDSNPGLTTQEKNVTFLAKFDLKSLGTHEAAEKSPIRLYNNPNSGNFSISGEILSKENLLLHIFDASGKLVYQQGLSKNYNKEHRFYFQNKLVPGNYILNITTEDGSLIKNFKMIVQY